MKIEIIEATATMPKGTIKDVPDNVAKVMIANKKAVIAGTSKDSLENPYSKMKVDELRALCSERAIEFTDEKKAELIELLLANDVEGNDNEEGNQENKPTED